MKPPATIVLLAFLLNALAAPAGAQDTPGSRRFDRLSIWSRST